MFRIRLANSSDLLELVEIDRVGFTRSWDSSVYAIELAREQGWVAICEDQDNVKRAKEGQDSAAVLGSGVLWTIVPEAELIRVVVRPSERRQGVGRAILRAMLQHCRDRHCEVMHLEVASRNHAALHLYRSLGFEEIGRRRAYYTLPVDDAIRMRCFIGTL